MPLQSSITSLFGGKKRSALNISSYVASIRQKDPGLSNALSQLENAVYGIENAVSNPKSTLNEFAVTRPDGALLAWFGTRVVDGELFSGFWTDEAYIGPGGPGEAPFFCDGSTVIIGKNGQVFVQDTGGNNAAWLGVTSESPVTITAATNASPAVLTAPGNTYVDGDTIVVAGATGNTAINGYRIVRDVGTAGAGTFTMTDLTGTVINGNGAYAGTATATRFYAGLLAQTVAIGTSFADYKLRAFANGDLRMRNAEILLTSTSGTTTKTIRIDPDPVGITVQSLDTVTGGYKTTIQDGVITLVALNPDGTDDIEFGSYLQAGYYFSQLASSSIATSEIVDLVAFSGATAYGPLISLTQTRGSATAATASQSGDTLGGIVAYGWDGGAEVNYVAAIRAVAAENHAVGAHGASVVFETTPNGSATPSVAMTISQSGFVGVGCSPLNMLEVGDASIGTFTGNAVSVSNGSGNSHFDLGQGATRRGRTLWVYNAAPANAYMAVGVAGGTNVLVLQDQGGNLGVNNTVPGYQLDVTGDINTSTGYRVGGTAGVTGSQAVGVSVTLSTVNLQYKDHAGVNQTQTVVTNVTLNTSNRTYTGGIRTT